MNVQVKTIEILLKKICSHKIEINTIPKQNFGGNLVTKREVLEKKNDIKNYYEKMELLFFRFS